MLPHTTEPVLSGGAVVDPYPSEMQSRLRGPAATLAAACGLRMGVLLPPRAGAIGEAAWEAAGYRIECPSARQLAAYTALRVIGALERLQDRGTLAAGEVEKLRTAARNTTALEGELSLHAPVSLLHVAPAAELEDYVGCMGLPELLALAAATGATRSRLGESSDLAELARRAVLEAACAAAEWMFRAVEMHLREQEERRGQQLVH